MSLLPPGPEPVALDACGGGGTGDEGGGDAFSHRLDAANAGRGGSGENGEDAARERRMPRGRRNSTDRRFSAAVDRGRCGLCDGGG